MIFSDDQFAILRMHGVREPAWQDVEAQFDDAVESLTQFLRRTKADKPHWYAAIADEAANEAAVFDLTAQGAYTKEHGIEATRSMLSKHGLKLGQVKQAQKVAAGDIAGQNNPYSDQFKGDAAARQARIASLLKSGSTKLCASLAKAAGKRIDGSPLSPTINKF
jgi:hypothetical protein